MCKQKGEAKTPPCAAYPRLSHPGGALAQKEEAVISCPATKLSETFAADSWPPKITLEAARYTTRCVAEAAFFFIFFAAVGFLVFSFKWFSCGR